MDMKPAKEVFRVGLCEGRHEIPEVEGYIFPKDFFESGDDMFDYEYMSHQIHEVLKDKSNVAVYVTGFTPALVEVINYCTYNLVALEVYHFNRDTQSYVSQRTNTRYWYPELHEGGYVRD